MLNLIQVVRKHENTHCGAFGDKRSGLQVECAQRIRILMDIDADRSYNSIAIHEVISFACGKARLFGLDHGIAESTILQIPRSLHIIWYNIKYTSTV